MEIEQAKEVFYAHKLLSILFPYNFPHIYAAFGKRPTLNPQQLYPSIPTGTIREKITIVGDTHVIDHPFRDVAMFFDEAEIKQDLLLDNQKRNFFIGSDRGEYYGDVIQSTTPLARLDEAFLTNWMSSHKVTDKQTGDIRPYTKEEILVVRNALKRLKHHNSFVNIHSARQYEDDGEET